MINQGIISEEDFVKKGRMKKSPFHMQPEELKRWEEKEKAYVRNYLFSIGQPLVYKKNGKMVAEYADGRVENI
ncbi:hypothetical protein [Pedobacter sp. V48]|jgi:hypothetical protein|uniref:hypothetical protein n=1 Tax=Pedobacter sp. V48 TaxID=509635 RepID=UPI0003E5939F|nr:hypothetical protein [Pedobacter sp. V48]ETZ19278.1 hypothetical protein N824_11090 [Pedobacter sp. V48]